MTSARGVGTFVRPRAPTLQQSSLRDLRVSLATAAYVDKRESDSNPNGHQRPKHHVTLPSGDLGYRNRDAFGLGRAARTSISFTR